MLSGLLGILGALASSLLSVWLHARLTTKPQATKEGEELGKAQEQVKEMEAENARVEKAADAGNVVLGPGRLRDYERGDVNNRDNAGG